MELRENLRKILDNVSTQFHQEIQTQLYTHHEGILQTPWTSLFDVQGLFTYKVDTKKGSVTWEMTENAYDHMSLSTSTFQVQLVDQHRTKQNLVAEYFTGKMNSVASWSAIDPILKKSTGPDMILQLGLKTWLVLVIGTTNGSGASLLKAYKSKFVKHKPTLNQIIKRDPGIKIYFWIVVVAPSEVYTTFRLDSNAINELVFRFRVGIAMEDLLGQLGFYVSNNGDLTDEEHAVAASIASLATAVMNGEDNSLNENSVMNFQNFTPNQDYIKYSMKLMTEETKKLSMSKQESIEEMNKAFIQVEHEFTKMGNNRIDSKAAVQMPLFIAQLSTEETLFSRVHVVESDTLPNVVDAIWRKAYDSRLANPERFNQLTLEQILKIALNEGFGRAPYSKCNEWRRVDVQLSEKQEMDLALDGLHRKKYKNHAFSVQRRSHQHRGFSLDCDTTDIENCLKIKPEPCDIPNMYMEKLKPLLATATDLASNTTNGLNLLQDLMSTNVALALCQISAVAQELAVCLNQQVSYEKWIYKKVLHYDIELLVKPTNSISHIFFLLRFRGTPLEKGTFRNVYYHDGWWYTDLLSINESRLDNFIRAPALYLNMLVHFRINVSKMEKDTIEQISPNGYSETIAMLTILIALEDKSQTEEMALNVRYLIMQFSKGSDPLSMPRPGPVILKTPPLLRSRLTVYLYKQIKRYCSMQWETLPEKAVNEMESEDYSADVFKNLLCPYTHTEILTFFDVVQVMYIAYAKNKNAIPQGNCDFGMVKKIAEHCLNVDPTKANKYNGAEDPDPGLPGPHEFSPSFLSQACTLLKQKFRATLGQSWMQSIENEIIKELVRATHHEALATLKASADISVIHQSGDGCGKDTKSCKCFEAVIKELNLDTATYPLLISDYTSIFKAVMSEFGGVCCYLFKKNQHGGLREIYVLTFKCRLLQLLPEVAARVLCSMCPEEVLTHPEKKNTGYETHHENIIILASEKGLSTDVLHRTSSEDKSKWSQGMNVNAFAFIFAQLLPSGMANAIARVMHSFRNKKVRIPDTVVNIFKKSLNLRIDTYDVLKEDFLKGSDSKHFVNIGGTIFMRTPTGMWQGILHYSSSLLHVLQTVHYKHVCKLYFLNECDKVANLSYVAAQKENTLGELIMDTVVSSDDSATYGSIILPNGYSPDTALKADQLLDFLLKLEVIHSRFFMMMESPKSIISSKTVGEFYSIFSCSRTYISPVVKQVLAATTIPRNRDLEGRQVEVSNALKDVLEEGTCHYQVHLLELVNSFLHYTALGLCTSRLFSSWTDMIVAHPDPHLGFLLLDLQDIAGTFGYDFKKYNSLIQTNVPVMPTKLQSGLKGSFSSGVIFADTERWIKFKNKVVSPGWKEYLEKNPHVLYQERGQTKDEIMSRLSVKACSKGINESLQQRNTISRSISSSVSLLAERLLSVNKLDLIEDNTSINVTSSTKKESLLHLTQRQIEAVENDTLLVHCHLTQEQVMRFYPNNHLQRVVSKAIIEAREHQLVKTIRYRKIKCKLEVMSSSTNNTVLPLITLVRWKWLSNPTNHALAVLKYSWNIYTGIFRWLRDTLEETLAKSPFENHIRLHGFIMGLDETARTLNVLCRRLQKLSTYEQILELSSHNQYPQLKRLLDEDKNLMTKALGIAAIVNTVCFAPLAGDVTSLVKRATRTVSFTTCELITLSKFSSVARPLIIYAVSAEVPVILIEIMLVSSGQGVIKQYIKAQKYNELQSSWTGAGRLSIRTSRVAIEALVYDKSVVAIKTKDVPSLQEDFQLINSCLTADGFSWETPDPIKSYETAFDEITKCNLTDWICSDQGLIHINLLERSKLTKTGEIINVQNISMLELTNTIVIQTNAVPFESLSGNLTIVRSLKDPTELLQVTVEEKGDKRSMSLLKFHGFNKPRPDIDLKNLFDADLDTGNLIECWIAGKPLNIKAGWALLKSVENNEPLPIDQAHILVGCNNALVERFLRRSFRWRALGTNKVQLETFNFAEDLPQLQDNKKKTEELQVLKGSMVDQDYILGREYASVAKEPMMWQSENLKIENDIKMDWTKSEDIIPDYYVNLSLEEVGIKNVSCNLEIRKSIESHLNSVAFRPASMIFATHTLWDNVIKKLDLCKMWVTLREEIMAGNRENYGQIMSSIFDKVVIESSASTEINIED